MKLKNLALMTLMISLAGCGSDSDGGSQTIEPNQPVEPVEPNQPVDPEEPNQPVEKIYSFEDLYDVSGFANVGATLTISPTEESLNSKLTLLEQPAGANFKQSAPYAGSALDLIFDKPGIYKFEYLKSNSVKYIEVEVKDSNTINGPVLKESLVLSDTTKPYVLTSNIGIPKDITLKVLKGVTLIANNKEISVEGFLDVSGDETAPVKILDAIIKPINDGGLIKIHHANIEGGSIYAADGNPGHATLDLQMSLLKNINEYIYLWYPVGEVKVIGNHFINSGGVSFGISEGEVTSVQILNNKFENWTSDYAIKNWANYGSPLIADISYNSFITSNKDTYAAVLPSGYGSTSLVMRNNYWGTTDVSKINALIYDRNDDLASGGYVEFEPFLTKPHSNTPK